MHPAFSVILFTTTSGAGYGLLIWLGLFAPLDFAPRAPLFGFVAVSFSVVLVGVGLLASMFHLGHPERAWRAVSQWRSSWLAREGVAAIATFVPIGLFGLLWVFTASTVVWLVVGWITAVAALITVASTGMIYGTLKPIRQWHNPWVVPIYLLNALMSGYVWFALFTAAAGRQSVELGFVGLAVVVAALLAKRAYWRSIDAGEGLSTPESATGLVGLGTVRLLERPHTEENYLSQEMGYRIARKHAAKLRRLAMTIGYSAPLVLTLLSLLAGGPLGLAGAVLAALNVTVGLLIERWLFFAEATHTVTLYYGARAA
jgi:DMSO reductase anchor subunit